jgi:hypothetical protein
MMQIDIPRYWGFDCKYNYIDMVGISNEDWDWSCIWVETVGHCDIHETEIECDCIGDWQMVWYIWRHQCKDIV